MNYRKKAILVVGALLCLNLSMYSQDISLKMSNVSVKKAITELQTQSGYSFVYIAGDINTDRKVSIDASQLDEAVKQILKGQNVSYEIQGKNIIVRKGTQNQNSTKEQKKQKIKGTVTDVEGEPVIGATVTEEGNPSNGTITDIDGNFTLEISTGSTLCVLYIGYKELRVVPVGEKPLAVTLKEDTQTLDEVVVIGFGTQKKVNLTGAVSTVDAETFEARPVATATQALQGVVPGLQISTSTGELDQNMNINIRGVGTIGDGSSGSPLILIDGMEGDINTVNPQDIENISVLKDAAAASIYGSRAPFGVILITTKKGKAGKASISYNNNFRIASPINLPKMMDSYTFANFFNAASLNNGGGMIFNDDIMQQMIDYQSGKIDGGVPSSSNG